MLFTQADFENGEPRDKVRIPTFLASAAINIPDNRSRDIPAQTIAEFVAGLAEEVEAAEARFK